MNNLWSAQGKVTTTLRRLESCLQGKIFFFLIELLRLEVRHKRNRPCLLNVLGVILYRGIIVILLATETRIDAHMLLTVQHLQEFLINHGINSSKSFVILCDLALVTIAYLCSNDFPL